MFRFLDLPLKVRKMIYHLALGAERNTEAVVELSTSAALGHRRWADNPSYTPNLRGIRCDLVCGNFVCVQILRVCKQIASEGAEVLYGTHLFAFPDITTFHRSLLRIFGPANVSSIRKLHLGAAVPISTQHIIFIADELPSLKMLTLATSFPIGQIVNQSFALGAVAQITGRHPRLKCAIWYKPAIFVEGLGETKKEWTVLFIRITEASIAGPDANRQGRKRRRREAIRAYELGDNLEVNHVVYPPSASNLASRIEYHISKQETGSLVLDCKAIRRTAWNGLSEFGDPTKYVADYTARTSESAQI